jgi:hypothetical protein
MRGTVPKSPARIRRFARRRHLLLSTCPSHTDEEPQVVDLGFFACRSGQDQESNAFTTASSMVVFGPVNHFFAEAFHHTARRSREARVTSGA